MGETSSSAAQLLAQLCSVPGSAAYTVCGEHILVQLFISIVFQNTDLSSKVLRPRLVLSLYQGRHMRVHVNELDENIRYRLG